MKIDLDHSERKLIRESLENYKKTLLNNLNEDNLNMDLTRYEIVSNQLKRLFTKFENDQKQNTKYERRLKEIQDSLR